MRRYLLLSLIMLLIFSLGGKAIAQFPFPFGLSNPFLFNTPLFMGAGFPFFSLPFLAPRGPFLLPGLQPRAALSLLAPVRMPRLTRHAAATVTIFFNPTLSVIQVTVLPVTAPTLVAPVVAPTVVAPTIAPTALLFLSLLTALGTTTATTPNVNVNTAVGTPIVNVNSVVPTIGLSALLPLI